MVYHLGYDQSYNMNALLPDCLRWYELPRLPPSELASARIR